MEKPLLEFKRFGRQAHQLIQQLAKRRGIEFMAGPQGQVLHFVAQRAEKGRQTLIKDIEQELGISKSVASNLVKRMEKNDLIFLEISPEDKRAKYVCLTEQAQEKMKMVRDFFDEVDVCLLQGVSEEELAVFSRVMAKFYQNIKDLESREKDV